MLDKASNTMTMVRKAFTGLLCVIRVEAKQQSLLGVFSVSATSVISRNIEEGLRRLEASAKDPDLATLLDQEKPPRAIAGVRIT